MRHIYDKKRVRDAVLSLSPGTVFTANDIVDLIGKKSPSAQIVEIEKVTKKGGGSFRTSL